MKSAAFIFLFAAVFLLTGCFQWDATRAVHRWGENTHSLGSKRISRPAPETGGWSSSDIQFHSFKGTTYLERNHRLNGDPDLSGKVYFYRTRSLPFEQLLKTPQSYRNPETQRRALRHGTVTWDHIVVDEDEARQIRSSDGYVLRVSIRPAPPGGPALPLRLRDCRILYKGMREGEEAWVVLVESIPQQERNDPTEEFLRQNPLYQLYHTTGSFKEQPVYLQVVKSPLYILTVPWDVITAPLQALAKIRVGP